MAGCFFVVTGWAATYTTTFGTSENPISEGGRWLNGQSVGIFWADCTLENGFVWGNDNRGYEFADPTALLTGTWGPNQAVSAKVKVLEQRADGCCSEVELRLRSVLTPGTNRGYEVLFSTIMGNDYVSIVTWHGPQGVQGVGWDIIRSTTGAGAPIDGDVVSATISNTTIRVFKNGMMILTAEDSEWSDGNPGIGFYGDTKAAVGFSNFVASDGEDLFEPVPPFVELTAPVANASVSNSIVVSANASDNVRIAGVQFQIDGVNLSPEVIFWPYSAVWDTPLHTNGRHVVTAIARDPSGNRVTNAVSVTVSNVATRPSSQQLVVAFDFGESVGTTAPDLSGRGNSGTISAASWSGAGRYGGALAFDGSGMVSIQNSPSLELTNGMTLEAWVYPTARPTNWTTILLKETVGYLTYGLVGDPVGRPSVYVVTPLAGLVGATASTPLNLNTWTHVAGTYDGNRLRLYIDGTEVANNSSSGTINSSSSPLRVGGNTVWGEYFAGKIDDIRVYSSCLQSTEIIYDMATPVESIRAIKIMPVTQSSSDILRDGYKLILDTGIPASVAIDYSGDFFSWQQLAVVQLTNGPVNFLDRSANPAISRFYRARRL